MSGFYSSTDRDPALCPGCFAAPATAAPATAAPCATCGFDPSSPRPLNALPAGCVLNRQFLIGRVLGHPGGFGITYLAFDQRLHKRVAIKEYLPRDLAARAADSTRIQPYSTEDSSLYQHGLQQFEREARILAQLDHPNIVRVMQFFEAHGSAYLVMDYYSGETLAEYLNRQPNGRMQEADALRLIQPILDGLRAVHAKQLLHRDIKPANLYLARSSAGVRPILIDFGAARHAVGERSRSLSVILSPGYAPFEQYSRKGDQGTWTDVYAAAAVLYRCLTGETPPDANDRVLDDDLQLPHPLISSQRLTAALCVALALLPKDRTPSIDAFRERLHGGVVPPPVIDPIPSQSNAKNGFNKQKANFITHEKPVNLIAERYEDHGDGTVTDIQTGLQWMRCSVGQEWTGATCSGSADRMTWDEIILHIGTILHFLNA